MNNDFLYVPLEPMPRKVLEAAISHNDLPTVRQWLERCPELIDQSNTAGFVPLVQSLGIWGECCGFYSPNQVRPEIFTLLVEAGANIQIHKKDDGTDRDDGQTLLYLAARTGVTSLVRLLLDRGADPNELGRNQTTSTQVADSKAGVLRIIPHVANVFPPIFGAIRSGNREIFEILRAAGAIWNVTSTDEWLRCGMLGDAAEGGMRELVQELLDVGADPNARNDTGNTPLHWAATSTTDRRVLPWLLDAGADLYAVNADEQTPLDSLRKAMVDDAENTKNTDDAYEDACEDTCEDKAYRERFQRLCEIKEQWFRERMK